MDRLSEKDGSRRTSKEKGWVKIMIISSWRFFIVIGSVPSFLCIKPTWSGFFDWIKATMLAPLANTNIEDRQLFALVDTVDKAVAIIEAFYSKYLFSQNY